MEKIRSVAIMCTGRAVMFGALAIFCVMFSFSFNPAIAFRAGAILTLLMSGVLVFKAIAVRYQNPKRTEVWSLLDKAARPAEGEPRVVYAAILRDVYAQFAKMSLVAACVMFAASFALVALGFGNDLPGGFPQAATR